MYGSFTPSEKQRICCCAPVGVEHAFSCLSVNRRGGRPSDPVLCSCLCCHVRVCLCMYLGVMGRTQLQIGAGDGWVPAELVGLGVPVESVGLWCACGAGGGMCVLTDVGVSHSALVSLRWALCLRS